MQDAIGTRFSRRIVQLAVQRVGPETLVYDELTHRAFCLNAVASAVWFAAEGTRGVDQIAVAATLTLQSPVSADLALFTLGELQRDGLISATPAQPGAPLVADSSRRELLRRLTAGAVVLLPAVAAIMAPQAAQAYNGCVNCDSQQTTGAIFAQQRKVARQRAAREAAAEEQQEEEQQRLKQLDANSY